jgi:DNA transformation protein
MSVSQTYLDAVLDQIGQVAPATSKRMFGGAGLYSDGLFFAVLDNDRLYFKVDDSNRGDFEAVGMGPFRPFPDRPDYTMQYYELPAGVLDDPDALAHWVAKAVAVAGAAAARGKKKRKR